MASDEPPPSGSAGSRSTLRTAGLAVCCVVGLGTVIGLIKRSGHVPETLSLPPLGSAVDGAGETTAPQAASWPKPRDGQIVLEHAGPWKASKISAVGPLVIRGAAGVRPIVEVENDPLEVWGERVLVSGIDFRRKGWGTSSSAGDEPKGSLLAVSAQLVQIQECRFEGPAEREQSGNLSAAVQWSLIDESPGAEARALVKNSAILGSLRGIEIPVAHGSVAVSHVLKSGSGELLAVAEGRSASAGPRTIHLRNTTIRGECPLLRLPAGVPTRWHVTADHTAFGIQSASLFEFTAERPPDGWEGLIEFEGRSTVVSLGSSLVGGRGPGGTFIAWPSESLRADGLQYDDLQFAGEPSGPWGAHQLTGLTIPLPDETLPGIGPAPF